MSALEDILSNSTAVYNTTIWQVLNHKKEKINNKLGRYWLGTTALVWGNDDARPRMGKFTTPWKNAKSHMHCKIPQLKFVSDTLSDLLDARAIEINDLAKKKNKRIVILWSGGIDSTCILVSFLKNLSEADLKNVSVALNVLSIKENLNFFLNHILEKIDVIDFGSVLVSNKFLKNNILIQGDPGDGVHYPGTWHFDHLIKQGKHLNNFMDHLDEMAVGVNFNKSHKDRNWPELEEFCNENMDEGFGPWYINKVKDNIIDCKVDDYITTVADFWWWHYFNIKWNHYTQCVLFNMRKDFTEPLDPLEVKEYFDYTYYNSDAFQNWAWTNLKKLVREDAHKTLKLEARQYIFDYDKDQNYFDTKRKMPSPCMGNVPHRRPFIVFDKDYVGHKNNHNGIHYVDILKILLEKYDERN